MYRASTSVTYSYPSYSPSWAAGLAAPPPAADGVTVTLSPLRARTDHVIRLEGKWLIVTLATPQQALQYLSSFLPAGHTHGRVAVFGYRLHVRAAFPLDYAEHAGGFTRAVATSPFVLCETLRAQRLPVPAFTLALRSGKTQTYSSAILYYRTAAERDESIGKSIAIAGENGVRHVVIQKLIGRRTPATVCLFLMPGSRRRCRPRERVNT